MSISQNNNDIKLNNSQERHKIKDQSINQAETSNDQELNTNSFEEPQSAEPFDRKPKQEQEDQGHSQSQYRLIGNQQKRGSNKQLKSSSGQGGSQKQHSKKHSLKNEDVQYDLNRNYTQYQNRRGHWKSQNIQDDYDDEYTEYSQEDSPSTSHRRPQNIFTKYTPKNKQPLYTEPFNRLKFMHTNFRFIVSDAIDINKFQSQADLLFDWEDIIQVEMMEENDIICPVTQDSPPELPQIAPCGHVFSYEGIMFYFQYLVGTQKEAILHDLKAVATSKTEEQINEMPQIKYLMEKPIKCPICNYKFMAYELRNARVHKVQKYQEQQEIEMYLIQRPRSQAMVNILAHQIEMLKQNLENQDGQHMHSEFANAKVDIKSENGKIQWPEQVNFQKFSVLRDPIPLWIEITQKLNEKFDEELYQFQNSMESETHKQVQVIVEALNNLKLRVEKWSLKYLQNKLPKDMEGTIAQTYNTAITNIKHAKAQSKDIAHSNLEKEVKELTVQKIKDMIQEVYKDNMAKLKSLIELNSQQKQQEEKVNISSKQIQQYQQSYPTPQQQLQQALVRSQYEQTLAQSKQASNKQYNRNFPQLSNLSNVQQPNLSWKDTIKQQSQQPSQIPQQGARNELSQNDKSQEQINTSREQDITKSNQGQSGIGLQHNEYQKQEVPSNDLKASEQSQPQKLDGFQIGTFESSRAPQSSQHKKLNVNAQVFKTQLQEEIQSVPENKQQSNNKVRESENGYKESIDLQDLHATKSQNNKSQSESNLNQQNDAQAIDVKQQSQTEDQKAQNENQATISGTSPQDSIQSQNSSYKLQQMEKFLQEEFGNSWYYYQCKDGQLIFLHPLSMKMLKEQYQGFLNMPLQIKGTIYEIESYKQNVDLGKKLKMLQHLPNGTQYFICEIDVEKYVSQEVIERHRNQMDQRQKLREKAKQKEDRKEEKRQKNAKKIDDFGRMVDQSYLLDEPKLDRANWQNDFPQLLGSSPPTNQYLQKPPNPQPSNVQAETQQQQQQQVQEQGNLQDAQQYQNENERFITPTKSSQNNKQTQKPLNVWAQSPYSANKIINKDKPGSGNKQAQNKEKSNTRKGKKQVINLGIGNSLP